MAKSTVKKKGGKPAGKPAPKKKAVAKAPAGKAKALPKKPTAKPQPAKSLGKTQAAARTANKPVVKKPVKAEPAKKGTAPVKSGAKGTAPVAAKAAASQAPSKTGTSKPSAAPTQAKGAAPAKAAASAPTAPKPIATPKAEVKPAAPPAPAAPKGKAPKVKEPVTLAMTGLDPLGAPPRNLQRAKKERFNLEFYMNATPGSLYDLLSSPSGLSEWFCDDVDIRGDEFTFRWGMDSQVAICLGRRAGELMRFQWQEDDDPGAFFELRIRIDPMTNETCLVVTDHAWPNDLEESKALWSSQIHTLQRVLGA